MRINGEATRSVWREPGGFGVLDQTKLPWAVERLTITTLDAAAEAIAAMRVRGAPLIGAVAAYGVAVGLREDPSDAGLARAHAVLLATRPTAVNLAWALDRIAARVRPIAPSGRADAAFAEADAVADEDVEASLAMGRHGLEALREAAAAKRAPGPLNILTHCNAGWLATVDRGSGTAAIYAARDAGLDLHVWVDETRPRSQGALLTAFELREEGVPHTVIPDNSGGHLMRHGLIDVVMVGSDRVTASGDVCNKIGTYLKALAAHDNGVPFYAAMPSSTIDFSLADGLKVPIEERAAAEVAFVTGPDAAGELRTVRVVPEGCGVANHAFDVTPARLVTGLVTERGLHAASAMALAEAFPERARAGT